MPVIVFPHPEYLRSVWYLSQSSTDHQYLSSVSILVISTCRSVKYLTVFMLTICASYQYLRLQSICPVITQSSVPLSILSYQYLSQSSTRPWQPSLPVPVPGICAVISDHPGLKYVSSHQHQSQLSVRLPILSIWQ